MKRRTSIRLVLVLTVAVGIGVASAFVLGSNGLSGIGNYTLCALCAVLAPRRSELRHRGNYGSENGQWRTDGIAYRDSDAISMNSSRCWSLWYSNTGKSSGCGTSGIIGSTPGQTYAYCSFSGSDVFGYCNSFFH